MIDVNDIGNKLKNYRKMLNFTQLEVARKIGVSDQAVSKWEKGECLPDMYNLKLLSQVYRISIDSLLDTFDEHTEKITEIIKVGDALFEIIEKPAAVFAGIILYAKDFPDYPSFNSAIGAVTNNERREVFANIIDCVLPISDMNMSINFWLNEKSRGFGFVRMTNNTLQPDGVGIYKMPASLYIRAYTNGNTARLLAKDKCEIWELFAYIRNYIMPSRGFMMAENGAQELEVYDTSEHKTGYAYMPVKRI